MSARAGGRAAAAGYEGYVDWKGWRELFAYTPEDAQAFAGETRGLSIAGARVLEIGFGAGGFLAWAKAQGAEVCGIEVIPELVAAAREAGVEILPADIEAISPAEAGRFDTIVAFDVFEHFAIDDVARRLHACATLLKPGGHIVLRFPNAQSPFGLAPQFGDPTHKSALSRSVIEQLTTGGPLEVVRYGRAFRVTGGGIAKALARRLRYLARDAIAATLNATYAQSIPWDPVVVIVLRRRTQA